MIHHAVRYISITGIALACSASLVAAQEVTLQKPEDDGMPQQEFGQRYTFREDKFSISFPELWKVSEIHKEDVVVAAFSPPDPATGVSANVVVSAREIPQPAQSIDERMSLITNELQQLGNTCKIIDNGTGKLNDLSTRWIVYTQKLDEYQFQTRITLVVENGYEFRIGSFANPPTFARFDEYFRKIENSFVLLSDPEDAAKAVTP